jgi:hypothetical protein
LRCELQKNNNALDFKRIIRKLIMDELSQYHQPSAKELLNIVEKKLGLKARWEFKSVVSELSNDHDLSRANREYFSSLISSGALDEALHGDQKTNRYTISSIDTLLKQSQQYRTSDEFNSMIEFMGRFRDYAPYNNMLVKVQNPSCGFYATAKDWYDRFGRELVEDARPMLILAPMHPVMLVYDLDQTEGEQLPEFLLNFAKFDGDWKDSYMERIIENADRNGIRINFKDLSSTRGGFATLDRSPGVHKMRIAIHDGLDKPSQFGVICHEVAHILLGHLGSDRDNWWPSRTNLRRSVFEVEAEAVAKIVTERLGLTGSSEAYLSGHLKYGKIPDGISLDMIAKVAGKIERMSTALLPRRKNDQQQLKLFIDEN